MIPGIYAYNYNNIEHHAWKLFGEVLSNNTVTTQIVFSHTRARTHTHTHMQLSLEKAERRLKPNIS